MKKIFVPMFPIVSEIMIKGGRLMFEDGEERLEAFNQRIGHGELELTHCGYERCVPGFAVRADIRNCYLIHYIMSGNGFFQQGNRTYEVGPGQWFVIFPGHVVSYYAPDPNDPWVFGWFGFIGRASSETLNAIGVSFEQPVGELRADEPFLATLEACTRTLSRTKTLSNSFLKSCLFQLIYHLEQSNGGGEPNVPPNDKLSQLYQDAVAFIDYNYNKAITIQDVADHMKVDRTYCWKIFQRCAGQSPQQYLMQYRIEKAAELLQSSDLSLSETAQCVGIPDLFYFSKLFKKLKGVPPSRFRKAEAD